MDKKILFRSFSLILFSILFFACATTRVVKPLAKGTKEIGVSAGGPIMGFSGIIMPIPMTSVYYAKGITDSLSVFGGLNGTSLLFGTAQIDLGATYEILHQKNWQPGISLSPVLNLMLDRWEWKFRAYPQLDANAYWNYRQNKGLLYVGMSNWFVINQKKMYDQKQTPHWIPNIQLGTRYQRPKIEWILESRYVAMNYQNGFSVVDYKGIGQKGAFGVYFGVNKKF